MGQYDCVYTYTCKLFNGVFFTQHFVIFQIFKTLRTTIIIHKFPVWFLHWFVKNKKKYLQMIHVTSLDNTFVCVFQTCEADCGWNISLEETVLFMFFFDKELYRWPLLIFRHSPILSFVLGACVFFPAEVLSGDWGAAVGSPAGPNSIEGSSGLSRDSVSWSISLPCSGSSFSRMWGFRWGPSSSYKYVKFVMRSSSDMLRASLAWMMPMFHWAWSLRGTEGAVCVTQESS